MPESNHWYYVNKQLYKCLCKEQQTELRAQLGFDKAYTPNTFFEFIKKNNLQSEFNKLVDEFYGIENNQ